MTYIPMKHIPLIVEEKPYVASLDQLVMIEEKMPAMEIFGFPKRNANTAPFFDSSKVKLKEALSSGSYKIAQKTAVNLRNATTNWTHAMSKATNDCVSQLFKANKNRVALLSGALKRYQDEAKKCKKEIDNRQNPPEKKKEYEEQYVQLLEKIDGTKKLILEAKAKIVVPISVLSALEESNQLSTRGIQTLSKWYAEFKDLYESKSKETSLRYGMLNDEKYHDLMMKLISYLRVGSSEYKALDEWKTRANQLNSEKIFGAHSSEEDKTEYSIQRIKEINAIYDLFNKMMAEVNKRVTEITYLLSELVSNRPGPYSFENLLDEIVFLTLFCSHLSTFMDLYLKPHFGVLSINEQINA